MSEDWTSEYARMIDDCEKRQERLTEWECSFIDSVSQQLAKGRVLSQKQIETIDRIWEKATARG